MERNHPLLYLYGNPDLNREQPAKVHIVYSRERNEPTNDGGEGEWICKVVSVEAVDEIHGLTSYSVASRTMPLEYDVSVVKPFEQVWTPLS